MDVNARMIVIGCAALAMCGGCMIKTQAVSNAKFVAERQAMKDERAAFDAKLAAERQTLDRERNEYERQKRLDYDEVLAQWRNGAIDFVSEAAWAERVFATDSGEKYDAIGATIKADEYATIMRSEYARVLRFLAAGGSVTNLEDRFEIFIGAICVGRPHVAAWALTTNMNINAVSRFDDDKRTALMWALSGNDEETIRFIWKLHPSVSAKNSRGQTALHYAVRRGSMHNVSMLVMTDPSLVSRIDGHGMTPLYDAIAFGRIDIGRYLLKKGSSLTVKRNPDGFTPFAYSCARSQMDFIGLFESCGAKPTAEDFAVAVQYGNLEVVKWFVEKRFFSVNDPIITRLENAGKIGSSDVKDYLHRRGMMTSIAK